MIRAVVVFWFCPLAFFWVWYFVSLNDAGFGLFFFSRELHDTVFAVYGQILGLDPASIPALVVRAMVVDSLIVFALIALRKHRAIARWVRIHVLGHSALVAARADSLSKAP